MHVIARSCVLHVEEPSWCAMGEQAAETFNAMTTWSSRGLIQARADASKMTRNP